MLIYIASLERGERDPNFKEEGEGEEEEEIKISRLESQAVFF